jgi:phosphoglycerate kinase
MKAGPPHIKDVPDLAGRRVLLRSSLNVPIVAGSIADDLRLRHAIVTLNYLQGARARTIIVGHIGRDPKESLSLVCDWFSERVPVRFAPNIGEALSMSKKMSDGDIIMVENLRQDPGERDNDEKFAKELSGLGEIFVNDAFSVCHREHSSIVGVPKYLPSYAGFLVIDEMDHLSDALRPNSPSLFILAGAKFETKEPLMRKFLDIYDRMFIGGALANDFFLAEGLNVGESAVSESGLSAKELLNHKKIVLPEDVTIIKAGKSGVKLPSEVVYNEKIVDCGPKTIEKLNLLAGDAKSVLWNGPLGTYESGYSRYTLKLAEDLSNMDAITIVGGGDTAAAISKLGIEHKFNFISTGGGAMLQFLADETLPGIEALRKNT